MPAALDETTRVRLSLKPGERGTKQLLEEYGERLVCVRYRYDEAGRRRLKTVELVVEEAAWQPKEAPAVSQRRVSVRVAWQEVDLRRAVKGAGGQWNPHRRVWEIRHDKALDLGLEDRIVEDSGI